ncbi:PQQ-binding-like beta-propeller repeat protein [Uniformispora flossi]
MHSGGCGLRARRASAALVVGAVVLLSGCSGGGGSPSGAGTPSAVASAGGPDSPGSGAPTSAEAPAPKPAGDGSLVYVAGGNVSKVFGVNAANGEQVWGSPVPARQGTVAYSSQQVVGGTLYVSTGASVLALDPKTGKMLRTYTLPAPAMPYLQTGGMPAVVGNSLYVYRSDGTLYAFDVATGAQLWNDGNGTGALQNRGVIGRPVVGEDEIFMPNPGLPVNACINAKTGAKLWGNTDLNAAGAAFGGTSVYVDGYTQRSGQLPVYVVEAMDAATGAVKWTWTAAGATSAPAFANGTVYVLQGSSVFALDAATGWQTWTSTVPDRDYSAVPTIANGRVYLTGYEGAIYTFDATTGAAGWSTESTGSQVEVTVNGDTAYLSDRDGNLTAMDAATGKSRWTHGPYT